MTSYFQMEPKYFLKLCQLWRVTTPLNFLFT